MDLLRIIRASSLSLIPCVPFVVGTAASAQPINVDLGRSITPFGAASIDVHKGVLTAAGVSALGVDGLDCDVLGVTLGRGSVSWGMTFNDAGVGLHQDGSVFVAAVSGSRGGAWTTSSASVQRIGDDLLLGADVYNGIPRVIDILDRGGNVVFTDDDDTPAPIAIRIRIGDWTIVININIEIEFNSVATNGESVCSWTIDLSAADVPEFEFVNPETGEVVARGVTVIVRETAPAALNIVTGATISGQNLAPFELQGMTMGAAPTCMADFNHDAEVNSQDFFDFLTAFFAADPAADVNLDGSVNSQDFFDFLTAIFAGC